MAIKTIYKKIRKHLSPQVQAKLSKTIYAASQKPYCLKDSITPEKKFPEQQKGGMILSADFELAWAFRYSKEFEHPYDSSLKKAHQARKNFPELIKLFEKYHTPITWATVGHLFLRECSEKAHDWMNRLPYFNNRCWLYDRGDWYDHDPHTDWKQDPEWYAPDLIEIILNSGVNHELGSHTFSHVDFSYQNCPPEVAEDEISASVDAMNAYGVRPISICFPSGTWGNVEVLKKNGFVIYRKKLKDDVVAYPYRDHLGLLVTPTSESFGRLHKSWSADYYASRYIKNITKAIQTGTIAHFMFHPSMDEWTLTNVMPKVLDYAAIQRDKGDLWIGTMGDIAVHINKNKVV